MRRLVRVLLAVLLAGLVTAPPAAADPRDQRLGAMLGDLWETFLETPNPALSSCVQLDARTVAPFTLDQPISCTVTTGTRIFVNAWSSECSTEEAPPYFGTDETSLRSCAQDVNAEIEDVTVTIDGRPVGVNLVETPLLRLDLPEDSIFGGPARRALSVAHGWVVLLHPLPPGTHEIVLQAGGRYLDAPFTLDNTTTITVRAGKGR